MPSLTDSLRPEQPVARRSAQKELYVRTKPERIRSKRGSMYWGRMIREMTKFESCRKVGELKDDYETNLVLINAAFQPVIGLAKAEFIEGSLVHWKQSHRLESFIDRARRLDEQERTDAALDLIYDSVDERLRQGDFDTLELIIDALPVEDLSTDLLLAMLTATLPARTRLKQARTRFFSRVETSVKKRREYEEGLLSGLE